MSYIKTFIPKEFKVVPLRDCPMPNDLYYCDTADLAAAYFDANIRSHPMFNPEVECFITLILNVRKRIKGHFFISLGLQDQVFVSPREVFRGAIIASAAAVILMHNHPSGESTPSDADVRITRDLIKAGQLLKVEVLDHIIMGQQQHTSLRERGYFYP